MHKPFLPAFGLWRDTLRAALAAERELYRAQLDHCAGRAPPPPRELVMRAWRLQREAANLRDVALGEMARAARSLQPSAAAPVQRFQDGPTARRASEAADQHDPARE